MNNDEENTAAEANDEVESALCAKTKPNDHQVELLKALNTIIFLQIGSLYYLDNMTILFFIRTTCQNLYVAPRLFIIVLIVNVGCFLVHFFSENPEGPIRGYKHGGVIIDFVGESIHTSRWRCMSIDILIFVLQTFMMLVYHERFKNKPEPIGTTAPAQNIETEEEGRRRSEEPERPVQHNEEDGIELDDLGEKDKLIDSEQVQEDEETDTVMTFNFKTGLRELVTAHATTSLDTSVLRQRLDQAFRNLAEANSRIRR